MPFVYWLRCVLGILQSRWQWRVKSSPFNNRSVILIYEALDQRSIKLPPLPSIETFLDEFVTVLTQTFGAETAHCVLSV